MKYLLVIMILFGLGGCTVPSLLNIDASKNVLNVGSKRSQPINFRTKE